MKSEISGISERSEIQGLPMITFSVLMISMITRLQGYQYLVLSVSALTHLLVPRTFFSSIGNTNWEMSLFIILAAMFTDKKLNK